MNYRCLTCGFVQDFAPTPESVALHHPWMVGLSVNQCPACTKYIQVHGGRKNGKIQMPDISSPGVIIAETSEVLAALDELQGDWHVLQFGSASKKSKVRTKHAGKKIFGWSPDEIEELAKVNL